MGSTNDLGVHFWLQPSMIQEPVHNRHFELTNYTDISVAYRLLRQVCTLFSREA